MLTRRIHAVCAVFLLVGVASSASGASGDSTLSDPSPPSSEPSEAPIHAPVIEREQVRFVSLDLIAQRKVNGQWKLIGTLQPGQVNLYLDEAPISFDVFETHCPAAGSPTASAADPSTASDGSAAAGVRRFILYFDLYHLKSAGSSSAFDAARKWAASGFRPGDEVMIIVGGFGLRIVRRMLPATDRLEADLRRAEKEYRRTFGWAEGEGNEQYGRIREINDAADREKGGQPAIARGVAKVYADQEYHLARQSLQNLQQLMAIFESIEGTKNLVFFEETLRRYPGQQYPYAADTYDMQPFLHDLALAANERNVRIYPVDAGGMEGVADEALRYLAAETGGRFYMKSNDLSPLLGWVDGDEECYYRIGFRVRPKYSGTVARIRVEIENPRETAKYHLRYRHTLQDMTGEERDVERIRGALLEPATADDFPIDVEAVPLVATPGGGRVHLQVRLPFDDLLKIPAGEPGGPALSEVFVGIAGSVVPLQEEDASDGRSEARSILWEAAADRPPWHFYREALLQLPHGESGQPGAGRDLLLAREIVAPPGRYRLIVVAQDRLAQELGGGWVDFEIPATPAAVGEVRFFARDPRAFALVPKDGESAAAGGDKQWIGAVPAALDEGSVAVPPMPPIEGAEAFAVYGLCDLANTGNAPFTGWHVDRGLTCGGSNRRFPGPPTTVRLDGDAARCALVIDPLPDEARTSPDCTYELLARPAEGEPQDRTLPLPGR